MLRLYIPSQSSGLPLLPPLRPASPVSTCPRAHVPPLAFHASSLLHLCTVSLPPLSTCQLASMSPRASACPRVTLPTCPLAASPRSPLHAASPHLHLCTVSLYPLPTGQLVNRSTSLPLSNPPGLSLVSPLRSFPFPPLTPTTCISLSGPLIIPNR